LLSYGSDSVDLWRRTATYVDRILRGAKPGDLPVQFPVKYEMAVNLKTAKALGLTVPQSPAARRRGDRVVATAATSSDHHSASRARIIAGLSGFFTLIQSFEGPER
jgi:ABC-type uncharacterized transport system substrate-binding protein